MAKAAETGAKTSAKRASDMKCHKVYRLEAIRNIVSDILTSVSY